MAKSGACIATAPAPSPAIMAKIQRMAPIISFLSLEKNSGKSPLFIKKSKPDKGNKIRLPKKANSRGIPKDKLIEARREQVNSNERKRAPDSRSQAKIVFSFMLTSFLRIKVI